MINNKIQLTIYATNSDNFYNYDLVDDKNIETIIFDSLDYELDLTQEGIDYLQDYNFLLEINEKFKSGYFEVSSKEEWLQIMQGRIDNNHMISKKEFNVIGKNIDYDLKKISFAEFRLSVVVLALVLLYLILKFLFPNITTVNIDNSVVSFGFKLLAIVFIMELLSIYRKNKHS